MSVYLCHEQPDLYHHDAEVIGVRDGAIALSRSAFHPGGGGQVSDVGTVTGPFGTLNIGVIEVDNDGTWWHVFADPVEPARLSVADGTPVEVSVDAAHRARVAGLHTLSHVLNAYVFDEFDGALVTGAQINGDGTGRMDFDLPEVDNDRIRALIDPVNATIAAALDVTTSYIDQATVANTEGLVRSMSVAPPPTADGTIRIVEIDGVDRQACGGTHLSNMAETSPIVITKVENKGRHNRRVRFQYAD